ncbi:alpha/beta hydrolase [Maridesulfovibrio sp.]|uniref:alpha/beta hydrolase n=1 Tax=Maridesulfovibrio sp. TaxID=2795000 RepID=UPI002A1884AD|nr:alpha/beta hydrolase [Maridesulfovibrio sp.]
MDSFFVSGWAGDPAQYPGLPASFNYLVPFSGFNPQNLAGMIDSGGDLLVGWSTGAHMLLRFCPHLFSRFGKVVLAAPFLAFTDSFPERLLRGMIKGMDAGPAGVVAAFRANCADPTSSDYDPEQTDKLIEGLEFLISSKIEFDEQVRMDNLILVYGTADRIVRRKAFDRVCKAVQPADIVLLNCGHKIPEKDLLNVMGCVSCLGSVKLLI